MTKPKRRTIPISENGRMNLPADMRHALGLQGSGYLILTQAENEIRMTTTQQALSHAQELAAAYKPSNRLASDMPNRDQQSAEVSDGEQARGESHG